ncbi:hypothetical protein [Actinomadura rugatobispora]|uniref:Alpha/beta hydrolase n=1 Tax=Actinomadura rugatobispora TaxID=1994 RepID=A0ABW0ZZ04_9ACTN|nr:hypothetical protein GCM10010200_040680 [Actinomadura rugatobispora]
MTPGTLVLLHSPYARSAAWGDLPEMLRLHGLDVVTPDVPDSSGPRYVARASLVISATAPTAPLVLVARGGAGPLLPGIALAQRAAHRKVGGYVFLDAELPRLGHGHAHDHDEPSVPVPPDWPEAPCGYLRTTTRGAQGTGGDAGTADPALREARLRGWSVVEQPPKTSLARTLNDLIATL